MGKGTIGVVAALAAWLGSASRAEAQGIGVDVTGPSMVTSDQTHMLVTANVSNASEFSFWVRVFINGVSKYYSYGQTGSGTSLSWTVPGEQQSMQTWPLTIGANMEIRVRVWTSSSNHATDSLFLNISAPPPPPPRTFLPADQLRKRLPVMMDDEALAWLDRKACEVRA